MPPHLEAQQGEPEGGGRWREEVIREWAGTSSIAWRGCVFDTTRTEEKVSVPVGKTNQNISL
jgi:hypothetical protein